MKPKTVVPDKWFWPIRHRTMRATVVASLGRLTVASVFAVSLTLLPGPAIAEAQSAPQGKEWPVAYISWQGLQQVEKKVEVNLGPEKIVGKSDQTVQFLIPVAQVVEVTYDTEVHHRGKGWVKAGGKMTGYPDYQPAGEEVIVAAPFLLVAAAAYPTRATKHFVHIVWSDQGKVRDVTLEAAKGKYAPFLQELRTVTGKEWRDLPAEKEKIRQEIEREKDGNIPVRLDQKVWLAETILDAGAYQLVLLQREENRGELYFFAGKNVNSSKVAGVALVEIERLSTGVVAPQVTYKDERGATMISEVRTPDKILRPAAQALPEGSETVVDMFKVSQSKPATVHFLADGDFGPRLLEPRSHRVVPLYIDGAKVGVLVDREVVDVPMTPGKHKLDSGDKHSAIFIDAADGAQYYVKVMLEQRTGRRHGKVTLVDPTQGQIEEQTREKDRSNKK
jgi:hypothetical protein